MEYRYTFEKNFKKRVILMSSITMPVYKTKYVDNGHKVIKREIFLNGKWEEII